jgi:hypothetical protein
MSKYADFIVVGDSLRRIDVHRGPVGVIEHGRRVE